MKLSIIIPVYNEINCLEKFTKDLTDSFQNEEVEFIFINDDTQEVERFFAGDFDTYAISRAQWWSEKFVKDEYSEINRNLIQRKKFINFLIILNTNLK